MPSTLKGVCPEEQLPVGSDPFLTLLGWDGKLSHSLRVHKAFSPMLCYDISDKTGVYPEGCSASRGAGDVGAAWSCPSHTAGRVSVFSLEFPKRNPVMG